METVLSSCEFYTLFLVILLWRAFILDSDYWICGIIALFLSVSLFDLFCFMLQHNCCFSTYCIHGCPNDYC